VTVHVVELSSIAPQPWRNGGGVTRELLAWPPGAAAGAGAAWQLRVSVADIERDGPFSAYPGVQRCFAVLEGGGVALGFEAGEHTLGPGSRPLAFDGADAPGCRLIDGPTRDLNLMVQATAGRAAMRAADSTPSPHGTEPWRGLYTASAAQLAAGDAGLLNLRAHSLAWSDAPTHPWRLLPSGGEPVRAWWLTLEQAA
jgi:environmental stress-induced protein Ves